MAKPKLATCTHPGLCRPVLFLVVPRATPQLFQAKYIGSLATSVAVSADLFLAEQFLVRFRTSTFFPVLDFPQRLRAFHLLSHFAHMTSSVTG